MRLLEKMPEHRYQTASAVVDDLREADSRFRSSDVVSDFELGRTALRGALARCSAGAREIVLHDLLSQARSLTLVMG